LAIILGASYITLATPKIIFSFVTMFSMFLCLLVQLLFFSKNHAWLTPAIVVNCLLLVTVQLGLEPIGTGECRTPLLVQGSLMFVVCQIIFLVFRMKKITSEQKELYDQFFPKMFLQLIGKRNIIDTKLGDHAQLTMSILFSDIRNFTTISEQMSPAENFNFINSYLSVMGPIVRRHNGFIQRVIGDGILALFPGTADDAVSCANAMRKELEIYNNGRGRAQYPPVRIGIGIHTGPLMIGVVGEKGRLESSVFSDGVNLAARIEELTKAYKVPILISDKTYELLASTAKYHLRKIDQLKVRGRKQDVTLWEVFDADPPETIKYKRDIDSLFDEAVTLYIDRQFEEAEDLFATCLTRNNKDETSQIFQERCNFYKKFDQSENGVGIIKHVSYQKVEW
jgi:class 3 adenylate cyclase